MITAITLNPCIDRTVELKNLTVDGHNRADHVRQNISGKGINVNVVLKHLGFETKALVLDHASGGRQVQDFLREQQIPYSAVPVPGELRVNLKLTDTVNGTMTEINERGAPVTPDTAAEILQKAAAVLDGTDILVADGSVPPGTPDTIYETIITMAKERHILTVLDASGDLLRKGLKAKPWLVKPNRFELESYYGETAENQQQLLSLAQRMRAEGAENVCLSMGKEGAAFITAEGIWFAPGNRIPVLGTQGAGDSMIAGICAAALTGLPAEDMLRWGVAAAQGSLILPGTQLCTMDGFREMLGQITIERLQ